MGRALLIFLKKGSPITEYWLTFVIDYADNFVLQDYT